MEIAGRGKHEVGLCYARPGTGRVDPADMQLVRELDQRGAQRSCFLRHNPQRCLFKSQLAERQQKQIRMGCLAVTHQGNRMAGLSGRKRQRMMP